MLVQQLDVEPHRDLGQHIHGVLQHKGGAISAKASPSICDTSRVSTAQRKKAKQNSEADHMKHSQQFLCTAVQAVAENDERCKGCYSQLSAGGDEALQEAVVLLLSEVAHELWAVDPCAC